MDNPIMEGLAHRPKAASMPKMKDMRKHGIAETHIQHAHDGSHHITHHPINHGEPVMHGAPDLDGLHDHLEEMLHGKPTKEEMAEEPEGEGNE
jgi:hypothetical protein